MNETFCRRGLTGFADLVPWADPYIASLVEKLQVEGGRLLGGRTLAYERAECPPPVHPEFSSPTPDQRWPQRGRLG